MAETFASIQKRIEKDPAFLASLVVDPKRALKEAGLNVDDPAEVAKLELLVRNSQESLRGATRALNVRMANADWGIGAGCCNSKRILPGGGATRGT